MLVTRFLKDSLHFISTKYQQNELCLLPRSTTISSLACSFNIFEPSQNIFLFQKLQARVRDGGPEAGHHPSPGRERCSARQQTGRAFSVRARQTLHPDLREPVPPQVYSRRQGRRRLGDILSIPREWRQFQVIMLHDLFISRVRTP